MTPTFLKETSYMGETQKGGKTISISFSASQFLPKP